MRKFISILIFVCHILAVVFGNPVKKAGVIFEDLVESVGPETVELNGSDQAVIVVNFDSSESFSKEIPLAFLAKSPAGDESGDDSSSDAEESSISRELLNPEAVEVIKEVPATASESKSDETGTATCVDTTPQASDSDENGTCLPTTLAEDESEESEEIPAIIMKKTIIREGDESSSAASSEAPDMIINPFLPIPDVAEILKPKLEEDEEEKLASDELDFNLIDSNDIFKHSDDHKKNERGEEQSILNQRFTSFINALMSSFSFGA